MKTKNTYTRALDAIEPDEQKKRETVNKLIEYKNNASMTYAPDKPVQKKVAFKQRISVIAASFLMVAALATGISLELFFGSDRNNYNNSQFLEMVDLGYLQYLTADISEATGLGIRWEKDFYGDLDIPPDDPLAEEGRTYLYKTEEDYASGEVEYDESGLTKVTFSKNISHTEDVYDSEGNLIDSNATVTQEEIPAQVNKVLVMSGYTFIQFVPIVEKSGDYKYLDENGEEKTSYIRLRPDDSDMTADKKGVFEFDKMDYFSDMLHQSFVIDNNTGYIYKIEDIHIDLLENGLIRANGDNLLYDFRITENDEFEIFSLYQNKDVVATEYFKDIYGNNYVKNNLLSLTDKANHTFYYKDDLDNFSDEYYLLTNEGIVFYLKETTSYEYEDYPFDEFWQEIERPDIPIGYFSISPFVEFGIFDANMAKNEIETDAYLTVSDSPVEIGNYYMSELLIKDGFFYTAGKDDVGSFSAGRSVFSKTDIKRNIVIVERGYGRSSYQGPGPAGYVKSSIMSVDRVLYWNEGTLYTINVWDDGVFPGEYIDSSLNPQEYYFSDYEATTKKLLENCAVTGDWTKDAKRFSVTGIDGAVYYLAVFDENGEVSIVKESEYIAPSQKVITLQPINKNK